jgi:hypothetical protein
VVVDRDRHPGGAVGVVEFLGAGGHLDQPGRLAPARLGRLLVAAGYGEIEPHLIQHRDHAQQRVVYRRWVGDGLGVGLLRPPRQLLALVGHVQANHVGDEHPTILHLATAAD